MSFSTFNIRTLNSFLDYTILSTSAAINAPVSWVPLVVCLSIKFHYMLCNFWFVSSACLVFFQGFFLLFFSPCSPFPVRQFWSCPSLTFWNPQLWRRSCNRVFQRNCLQYWPACGALIVCCTDTSNSSFIAGKHFLLIWNWSSDLSFVTSVPV